MTATTWTRNGEYMEFAAFTTGEGDEAVNHPDMALIHWSDAELAVHGIVRTIEPAPPPTGEELASSVDAMRDARIDGGFEWNGSRFQSRPSDRENVMGAATLAMAYMAGGGDPESLRWANPEADFVWITADNSVVPMTAEATVALFQAGVAFKSALTFYARGLKDALIAAEDPSTVNINDGWPE